MLSFIHCGAIFFHSRQSHEKVRIQTTATPPPTNKNKTRKTQKEGDDGDDDDEETEKEEAMHTLTNRWVENAKKMSNEIL